MTTTPEATKLYIKQCTECYAKLSIADFSLHRASPDGYQSQCKPCGKEYRSVRYMNLHGRVTNQPMPAIIRNVRIQNHTILNHVLTSREPVSLYGFTPHQPTIYRVTFGPHAFGRSMLITSECGSFKQEYAFSQFQMDQARDPLYIAGTLLKVLKENRIRLEFSESDMLDSKAEIYYLE